jgi:hypothetical protein
VATAAGSTSSLLIPLRRMGKDGAGG